MKKQWVLLKPVKRNIGVYTGFPTAVAKKIANKLIKKYDEEEKFVIANKSNLDHQFEFTCIKKKIKPKKIKVGKSEFVVDSEIDVLNKTKVKPSNRLF